MPAKSNPRTLIAGNWKMNGLGAQRRELRRLGEKMARVRRLPCEVLICPPATLLAPLAALARGTRIRLGGQDCNALASGPHTGEISAEMLADAGARYVIVGHSERRANHGETNALVRQKALAARRAGLTAIVCVGETLVERRRKQTLQIIGRQVKNSVPDRATAQNLVVAYEPVWAIGSGRTPTLGQIAEVHQFIREKLTGRFGREGARIRILYGGSVTPANAVELLAIENVNGALVGGASLAANDFWKIVGASAG